jgi:hypothetical protein
MIKTYSNVKFFHEDEEFKSAEYDVTLEFDEFGFVRLASLTHKGESIDPETEAGRVRLFEIDGEMPNLDDFKRQKLDEEISARGVWWDDFQND